GMLSAQGFDRGGAQALETAILPGIVTPEERTRVFAWYNELQDAGGALGALLAGMPLCCATDCLCLSQRLATRLSLCTPDCWRSRLCSTRGFPPIANISAWQVEQVCTICRRARGASAQFLAPRRTGLVRWRIHRLSADRVFPVRALRSGGRSVWRLC